MLDTPLRDMGEELFNSNIISPEFYLGKINKKFVCKRKSC